MVRKRTDSHPDTAPYPPTNGKDRQFVVALARGLEILRAFGPGDGVLGNQDLAERTQLPKPTVSRLTHTLTKLGYLGYSERLGKYHLGTGILSLGYAMLANTGVLHVARPHLQAFAHETNAAISLGGRDRLEMLYLEHCQGNGNVTLRLDVGSRIPLETTSMGRAFLAALQDDERRYLMTHIRDSVPADDWARVNEGIERAVKEVRDRGFCTSFGEWQTDINAVSVPIRLPDKSTVLAINCGGPAFQLGRSKLERQLGPRLVELARKIEQSLAAG